MKQCMDSDNLHRRLKKIIGQVQAIDRMVDEDVPCEDILMQINAAKSALHRVTVCATALSTATLKKPSKTLPKQWNASPTWRKPKVKQ